MSTDPVSLVGGDLDEPVYLYTLWQVQVRRGETWWPVDEALNNQGDGQRLLVEAGQEGPARLVRVQCHVVAEVQPR